MRAETVKEMSLRLHEELRGHLRRAMILARQGTRRRPELRRALAELRDAARRHEELERAVLGPALQHVDAWSEVRTRVLAETHADEEQALDLIADGRIGRSTLRHLIFQLMRGLRQEEKILLADEALGLDGVVTRDNIGA